MNFKEIRIAVESVSNEKGISEDVVFGAIEAALATATKRRVRENAEFRVSINWEANTCNTYRVWTVVDPDKMNAVPIQEPDHQIGQGSQELLDWENQTFNPDAHLTLEEAQEKESGLEIGDTWEESWPNVDFGRIMAQIARQVIFQKVREAERERVATDYRDKVGQLISGTVKRSHRDSVVTLDLGNNVEGALYREHLIPRQVHRVEERVRAYLLRIDPENKGPQLVLSRTCTEMLVELFKLEVPEIAEQVIEIRGAARIPGQRAKIAVTTNDRRIDAVGACVGMRGSRVQAVSNELANERIDVVQWDADPVQLVVNAMSPVPIEQIMRDDDLHSMDILVRQEHHAIAIGSNGENVRLASELSGWKLNIRRYDDAIKEQEEKELRLVEMFMSRLEVDEDLAQVLVEESFTSLEEVAYVDINEMLEIEGFTEEIVQALRERAAEALQENAGEEESDTQSDAPSVELLSMEGMTDVIAWRLASQGVRTVAELADLAIPDVLEMEIGVDAEVAGKLIMTAREPMLGAAGS